MLRGTAHPAINLMYACPRTSVCLCAGQKLASNACEAFDTRYASALCVAIEECAAASTANGVHIRCPRSGSTTRQRACVVFISRNVFLA